MVSASAAAWRKASKAALCTPPISPSPIHGVRSAASAGANAAQTVAPKGAARAAAASSVRTSDVAPVKGATILVQLMVRPPAFPERGVPPERHDAP